MRPSPPARVTTENVERLRLALSWIPPAYAGEALTALDALAAELDEANARADAADLMCAKAGSIAADAVADLEATKRERDEARELTLRGVTGAVARARAALAVPADTKEPTT